MDVHLNRFHIHGQNFGVCHDDGISFTDNPEKVVLSAFGFRTRERSIYEYDFSDEWLHEIQIEKRLSLYPKLTYPVCIDGKHAAPPEDFGGARTYIQMRQELKYRSVFGNNGIDDDFDDKNDPEYERFKKD